MRLGDGDHYLKGEGKHDFPVPIVRT
ncbi:hypothetical protein TNCT_423301, partial [Trichonephila clavata]